MHQENILQLSLRNPKGIEKKCLKRWFAYSADNENCSLLKSKHKKTEKDNKEPIYDFLQSKLLARSVSTNYKDFLNCSLLCVWAQTVLSQTLERPIPLLGQLTFLNPLMLYFKYLPESHTAYTSIMKQIHFFAETINTLDCVELKTCIVSLNDFFDLHFISQFYDWNFPVHSSNNQDLSGYKESEQMLQLRSSLFSVLEFLRPLFQNISTGRKNNEILPFYERKMGNLKNSENNDSKTSNKSAKNKMFNKKVPTILVGINEKNLFPEKVLTSCEHMFSANSLKPDAPDNLANAYSKTITFPRQSLLLSKIDDDSHQKQSWAPLDFTFPLAKFNLDYEKISGTTERFLKTINLNDSSEKSGNEDLTGNVCSQCASPDVLEETEIILKELSPAETFSLEAKKIPTSPDIFVNNIHTLSSSDMATTDNLFSEDLTIYKRKAVTILPGDFINKDVNEDQSFTANYQLACNETTEHVVPDINHSQIYGVTESSMFEEECLHLKELDAKSRTVFCWTSDSLNIPVSDQLSYPAVQQCSRPLRLGLSKKQKVKHLHKK